MCAVGAIPDDQVTIIPVAMRQVVAHAAKYLTSRIALGLDRYAQSTRLRPIKFTVCVVGKVRSERYEGVLYSSQYYSSLNSLDPFRGILGAILSAVEHGHWAQIDVTRKHVPEEIDYGPLDEVDERVWNKFVHDFQHQLHGNTYTDPFGVLYQSSRQARGCHFDDCNYEVVKTCTRKPPQGRIFGYVVANFGALVERRDL